MNKQVNITAAYKLRNAKSTALNKLEKKGKVLDQVEGPRHNTMLISTPSSQYGDE